MAPLPRPTNDWNEEEIKVIYGDCQYAMQLLDNSPIVSENYRKCLQGGREIIIDKIMQLIMDTGYFKTQYSSTKYVLYWRDAPEAIAKFLQRLDTVFTGNNDLKLYPAKVMTASAAGKPVTYWEVMAPLPKPTNDWDEKEIKIIYSDCQSAMQFLGSISEKYRQCLQRGRNVITEKIMELIMDTGYFKMQYRSTKYVLYWKDAPQGIAKFLQYIETVFTGDKDLKIRKKRLAPEKANAASAAEKPTGEVMRPLPRPTNDWDANEIKIIYGDCQSAMQFLGNTPIISDKYRHCLQRGRDSIMEKIMVLIMNTGYFKQQYGSSKYVLYWRDAPQCLAKFLQHLETVFTLNKDLKIRKKRLAPAIVMANSAAKSPIYGDTMAPLPRPTNDWDEKEIKIIYGDCLSAMQFLGSSPIISENYRECLQRGSGAIVEKMMELIMDTGYFKMQYHSTKYVLYWRDAPEGFAKFLQRLDTVFTGDKEVKIDRKEHATNRQPTKSKN